MSLQVPNAFPLILIVLHIELLTVDQPLLIFVFPISFIVFGLQNTNFFHHHLNLGWVLDLVPEGQTYELILSRFILMVLVLHH